MVFLTKIAGDHANVKSQTKRVRYATSVFQLQTNLFSEKTSHSHRESTSQGVPGAPSSVGQQGARVITRTHESLGCSLTTMKEKIKACQAYTAPEFQVLPHQRTRDVLE